MKVSLFELKALGFSRPMVKFGFKHPKFPRLFHIAIVDTGCPFVIIPEKTLKLRRIPYRTKTKYEKNVMIGPIELELRELGDCELFFLDMEINKIISLKYPVYAGIPLTGGELIQTLPSFLGNNFLKDNNLSIMNTESGNYLCSQ